MTSFLPRLSPPPFVGLTGLRMKLLLSLLGTALVFAYLLPSIFITIDTGHLGIKWSRFRGGTDMTRIYGEGTPAILPWDTMAVYDMRLQEIHDRVEVLTMDGLKVSLDITARYAPRAADLAQLHKSVGPDYRDRVVWPDVVAAVRHVVRQFKPDDLRLLGEAELSTRIDEAARRAVEAHWVDLDRVLVTRITLPDRLEAEIEDKLAQEQKVLAYDYILQQAGLERQKRLIEAKGIRDFQTASGVPFLKWRGLEVTEHLGASPNSKLILLGEGADHLPLVLNGGGEK